MTRQQTLRATLAWSFDLLDADEQILVRRLAVFAGSFGLEAAEDICAEDPLAAPGGGRSPRPPDRQVARPRRGGPRRSPLPLAGDRAAVRRGAARGGWRARGLRAPPSRLVRRARRERPDARRRPSRQGTGCGGWTWSATTSAPLSPRRWPTILSSPSASPLALWRFWLMRGYLAEGYRWLARLAGGGAGAHRGSRPRPARRLPRGPAARRPCAVSTSSAPKASRSSRELGDHAGMFDAVEVSTAYRAIVSGPADVEALRRASTRRCSSTIFPRPGRRCGRRTPVASPPGFGVSIPQAREQLELALKRAGELTAEPRPALWPLSYGVISVEPEVRYPLFLQEDTGDRRPPGRRRGGRRLHPGQPRRGRSGRGRFRPRR